MGIIKAEFTDGDGRMNSETFNAAYFREVQDNFEQLAKECGVEVIAFSENLIHIRGTIAANKNLASILSSSVKPHVKRVAKV